MDNEEGQKWPSMRRLDPNSTEGAPNGQSRFKVCGRDSALRQIAEQAKNFCKRCPS
jgi:hypothetical protein